jgi:hypothetical protein
LIGIIVETGFASKVGIALGSGQYRERFYERAVKKKVVSELPMKFGQLACSAAEGAATPPLLLTVFVLAFAEPDLNSRLGGQFWELPTMVLFATPAVGGWAYNYFWLCVGAYSSDWSLAQWL